MSGAARPSARRTGLAVVAAAVVLAGVALGVRRWIGRGPAPSDPATIVVVTIDQSPAGRLQRIDGFGTCVTGGQAIDQPWFHHAYLDDLGCSMLRVDLTPRFVAPYSDADYRSPWFGNAPPLKIDDAARPGGPDGNNCRTYTGPADYARDFGGGRAPIAVMTTDVDANVKRFDYADVAPAARLAVDGARRATRADDFKLIGSIWSPAPWLKRSLGTRWPGGRFPQPPAGTPWPFVWNGNFAGGTLDVSGRPLAVFDDGTGPTSALTQFARGTAAYVKGFQDRFGVRFYAIGVQNEPAFEEFYSSCTYPDAAGYLAAVKAVRREFDLHPDLRAVRILGPEDVLGSDAYGLWRTGNGGEQRDRNLKFLEAAAADPAAMASFDLFAVHGYAGDGVHAVGGDSALWRWWASGWSTAPVRGVPERLAGFTAYGKRSWVTETSGERNEWLFPKRPGAFPDGGAWGLAFKTQQALTVGRESAVLYWQFADASDAGGTFSLTRADDPERQPKYVAAKHFFKFIRPRAAAVRASAEPGDAVIASAFENDADESYTVVLVNRAAEPRHVEMTLPAERKAAGYRSFTSSEAGLWVAGDVTPEGDRVRVNVPAYGVVTVCDARLATTKN